MRETPFGTVVGVGDSSGGDEWFLFHHPSSGAYAVYTWGCDYGSGIHFAAQINETHAQLLMKEWEKSDYNERQSILDMLMQTYPGAHPQSY